MIDRSVRKLAQSFAKKLKPKPRITGLEYVNRFGYITNKGKAPIKWRTRPYQADWFLAVTDPEVECMVCIKPARVGWSAYVKLVIQYFTHWRPSELMVVQPTDNEVQIYSTQDIDPMYDEKHGVPVLRKLLSNKKSRTSEKNNYWLKRLENGALIHLVNAATPRSARMVERNPVLFEEPAAYDSPEGDTLENFFKRAGNIWNPFFTIGGTPIYPGDYMDQCFKMGDQQYRYYPCPHCGHYQQLTREKLILEGSDMGKMKCENCEVPIEYKYLQSMDEDAGWACPLGLDRSKQILKGTEPVWFDKAAGVERRGKPVWRSQQVGLGMSYHRAASWPELAIRYNSALAELRAGNPDKMQSFKNTDEGVVWQLAESARITAEGLAKRQQDTATGNAYPPDGATWEAPNGVLIVTLGVDTQGGDDSEGQGLRVHVWGWGRGEECWHLAEFAIDGDPQHEATLNELDPLAAATWHREDGARLTMALGAIDEGGNATEAVRRWCAKRVGTWIPVKGQHQPTAALLGRGVAVNFTAKNKAANNVRKDVHFFGVGYERSVTLLGHRLRIEQPGPGYIHFGRATTTQTLAEMFPWKRLPSKKPRADGIRVYSWVKPAGARDEAGDCWRYANAALGVVRRRYGQEERFWSDHESKALASITGGTTSGRNLLAGMMFA